MRRKGKSPQDIAIELEYATPNEVERAIAERFKYESQFTTAEQRQGILAMENARLDALQEASWDSAMYGDIAAGRYILEIIKTRLKANQMDAVDTQAGQHTILVVGGSEADYVEKLKAITADDSTDPR